MDNFLVILASVASSADFDLVSQLKSSRNGSEVALGRVLDLMLEKRVHEAKDLWVDYLIAQQFLPNNIINLYGGQQNLFLGFFGHVFKRSAFSECSNGPNVCGRFRREQRMTSELIQLVSPVRGVDNDVQSQTERFFANPTVKKCSSYLNKNLTEDEKERYGCWTYFTDEGNVRHRERICNGNRKQCEKQVLEGCWLLPFNIEKIKNIDVFDLSRKIAVGGRVFYLRGATLKEGNHFTCYVCKNDRWYYYCGMFSASGRRIKTPVSTGQPQIALYTS